MDYPEIMCVIWFAGKKNRDNFENWKKWRIQKSWGWSPIFKRSQYVLESLFRFAWQRSAGGSKKNRINAIRNCSGKGAIIASLCNVAGIPKSVYYYQKDNNNQTLKDDAVLQDIQLLSKLVQSTYGAKCLAKALSKRGNPINHKRIARIRLERDIASKIRRRKPPPQKKNTILLWKRTKRIS